MAPKTPNNKRPRISSESTPSRSDAIQSTPGSAQSKDGREEKEQKMARPWRRGTMQFGDMEPVQGSATVSLEAEKFNWADEVNDDEPAVIEEQIVVGEETAADEEGVRSELGQVTANGSLEEDNVEGIKQVGDSIVQDNLGQYETEVEVPKKDTVEESEQAEDSIVQGKPSTLEIEMDVPEEQDNTKGPEQVGNSIVQDNLDTFETEMDTPEEDTMDGSKQTEDTIVQNNLETSGLEVATQEDLMEGVDDKLESPEIQSAVAVEIMEVLDIAENAQDDLEHSEDVAPADPIPTKQDEDTLPQAPTAASDPIVPEDLGTLQSILKDEPSLDSKMDDKNAEPSQTKEPMWGTEDWWDYKRPSSTKPVVNLPSSSKQSTEQSLYNGPAISYAKVAAAAASQRPISMSPEVKKVTEKPPSKTPVQARVTPVRSAQSSTRIVPVVPRSFEKQTHSNVSPAIAVAIAVPADSEWEPVPTEALEKPSGWVLQTPKKARKTPLTTPVQRAQKDSDVGNEDVEDDEEDINTPASPYTPTKPKPKRRRPLSKTAKAAKAAQTQALAAAMAPVVEAESKVIEAEGEVEKETKVEEVGEVTETAEGENLEAPAVDNESFELKAVVETEILEVVEETEVVEADMADTNSSEVDIDIEIEQEVEVIVLAEDEVVQPAAGSSSIILFIGMLLVAWIVYSFIHYMPDILEYLKESFRSDVPDL
ncbi:hypothetical protein DL98DRAFT_654552 [Cadophora sp. DSE1049]|nr:hypothetical protein DL98DRAFT_654552 [Cadophora sp. DSE1049]